MILMELGNQVLVPSHWGKCFVEICHRVGEFSDELRLSQKSFFISEKGLGIAPNNEIRIFAPPAQIREVACLINTAIPENFKVHIEGNYVIVKYISPSSLKDGEVISPEKI